jgi:hypothetical protein
MMPGPLDCGGPREKGLSNYQVIKLSNQKKVDDMRLIMHRQQEAIIKLSNHQIIKLNRCLKEIITRY